MSRVMSSSRSSSEPPSGTITFLFTDIEGSSRLWEKHTEKMRLALARHDTILRDAVETRAGLVFKTIGDAFCVAFHTARDGFEAALSAQRALQNESWDKIGAAHSADASDFSIKVRMALHTGGAERRDSDYFGPTLNRVARLLAAAHGNQTLLSLATAELVRDALPSGVTLRDLGERRLKDLARPERIFQIVAFDLQNDFPSLRTLDVFPNNLPAQLTSFIGREREMEAVKEQILGEKTGVKQMINTAHLLTLTGTGGTGKTRLSLQVAADLLDRFPDGVWLTEFATISDPDLVPNAVVEALGLRDEPGVSQTDLLTNFLREKKTLLVFDNCEHVVAACARLAEMLLRACAELRILASSREPLGIAGERTFPVPPLALPELSEIQDRSRGKISASEKSEDLSDSTAPADFLEKLTQFEAVRLFIDRAVAVQPTFVLTNDNAPFVAEICHRLDGIPLAIELAAARVKVLTTQQIAERLNDRFRLLTGGSRTALPRQQTLRALIDWSFDLLSEPERALLRRLSVFARGRTLEAAEAVCSGDGVEDFEVLDLLAQLVDKSLVTAEKSAVGEPRYTMIESVWHFAQQKLADSGEREKFRARHLHYFLAFAEKAEPELQGKNQREWLARCAAEEGNFRAALQASIELEASVQAGLQLAAALTRFWEMRSLLKEGSEFYAELLSHPDAAPRDLARAKALAAAGRLAWISDDLANGAKQMSEALEIFREIGDAAHLAETLGDLSLFKWDAGDVIAAKMMLDEADGLLSQLAQSPAVQANKQLRERLKADLLGARALIAAAEGDHARALSLNEEGVKFYEELGDEYSADGTRWAAGVSAVLLGDFEKARGFFESVLRSALALGNKWSMPYSLEAFAALAAAEKRYERAATLLGAAEALRAKAGISTEPSDHPAMREILAAASEPLSSVECLAARRRGRAMSASDAANFALENESTENFSRE